MTHDTGQEPDCLIANWSQIRLVTGICSPPRQKLSMSPMQTSRISLSADTAHVPTSMRCVADIRSPATNKIPHDNAMTNRQGVCCAFSKTISQGHTSLSGVSPTRLRSITMTNTRLSIDPKPFPYCVLLLGHCSRFTQRPTCSEGG